MRVRFGQLKGETNFVAAARFPITTNSGNQYAQTSRVLDCSGCGGVCGMTAKIDALHCRNSSTGATVSSAGESAPSDYIEALVSGLPSAERRGHRFMVIQTGYFDDSGSHAASQYYVLAGFVAPVSDWNLVADEWAGTINEEGLAYFKMSHAMAMDGQFRRGWTIPLRDQLILKLVNIIEKIDPPRVECYLRREDFDTFVKDIVGGSAFNDPYFILFYQLILSVAVANGIDWNSDCDFIFDEQGKLGTDAVERWNWVKANIDGLQGPGISENLGSPPTFRNDIKVRPLQAADMFAWLVRDALTKGRSNMEEISRVAIGHLEGRNILRIDVNRDLLMKLGASFLVNRARLRGHL
jgi:hypothetical protein